MIANAVMFEHPMQKIYTVLPPPIEEMDELLAFIFTGPCQPTEDDFHRIPLLVRRNKVSKALEWLKLNHIDYADLKISYENPCFLSRRLATCCNQLSTIYDKQDSRSNKCP